MKFVHLTTQPAIGRIRRNGIRCGGGHFGRGVYAVPFLMLPGVGSDGEDVTPIEKRLASMILWRWLGGCPGRHRHMAAVVFETTSDHWPARLAFETEWGKYPRSAWESHDARTAAMKKRVDPRYARLLDIGKEPAFWEYDLLMEVRSPEGVGKILHSLQDAGFRACFGGRAFGSIVTLFPSPVAPHLIRKIVPLYRSNKEFKRRRDRFDRRSRDSFAEAG